jgi:hypothetical protein
MASLTTSGPIVVRFIAQPIDNAPKHKLLIVRGIPAEYSAMSLYAASLNSGRVDT